MTSEELRAIRTKHGLTQAEFAEMMKVSKDAIALYEQGKRPIPPWIDEFYGYALLKRSSGSPGLRAPGRPPTAAEAKKAEEKERLERERPIVCSVRFCEPGSGRPMDALTFRPYYGIDEQLDPRAKVVTRWVVYEHEHEIPWRRTPAIPMEGWSEAGWSALREQLASQLVAIGHPAEMAKLYQLSAGADWSWHKVETSRPECIVTPAAHSLRSSGLTVVS